jgi:hypothetical protein
MMKQDRRIVTSMILQVTSMLASSDGSIRVTCGGDQLSVGEVEFDWPMGKEPPRIRQELCIRIEEEDNRA